MRGTLVGDAAGSIVSAGHARPALSQNGYFALVASSERCFSCRPAMSKETSERELEEQTRHADAAGDLHASVRVDVPISPKSLEAKHAKAKVRPMNQLVVSHIASHASQQRGRRVYSLGYWLRKLPFFVSYPLIALFTGAVIVCFFGFVPLRSPDKPGIRTDIVDLQ